MSTFTDPHVAGFDPLNLTYANEIRQALRERREFLGTTGPADWSAGDDAHSGSNTLSTYSWRIMQNLLETHALTYINHTDPYTTDAYGNVTGVNKFTLTTWRAEAGLNASGFRRVTSWTGSGTPTFSYGKIEPGDIFGYWIYEDLQKGLDALRWANGHSADADFADREEYDASGYVTGADIAAADTAWAAAGWGGPSASYVDVYPNNTNPIVYRCFGATGAISNAQQGRLRGRWTYTPSVSALPFTAEVWVMLRTPSFGTNYDETFGAESAYSGAAENCYICLHGSGGLNAELSLASGARQTAKLGDISASPFSVLPAPPSGWTYTRPAVLSGAYACSGYRSPGLVPWTHWINKPQFTHTL